MKQATALLRIPAQFDKPEMVFKLYPGVTIIGKNKGDVQLEHEFVSAIHAHIEISTDGVEHWIEDLESTNGTFFGDATTAIRPRRFYQLTTGRKLRFGRVFAEYTIPDTYASPMPMGDHTAILSVAEMEKIADSQNEESSNVVPDTFDKSFDISKLSAANDAKLELGKLEAETTQSQTFPSFKELKNIDSQPEDGDEDEIMSLGNVEEEPPIVLNRLQEQLDVIEKSEKLSSPPAESPKEVPVRNKRRSTSTLKDEVTSSVISSTKTSPTKTSSRKSSPVKKENKAQAVVKEAPKRGRGRKKVVVDDPENIETTQPKKRKQGSEAGKTNKRTKATSAISVVFTGVTEADVLGKALKGLGVKVVNDWSKCTHLITDKIKRTNKFLCSLSSGKSIISTDWVYACIKAKSIVDTNDYILKDIESEQKWNFKLIDSLNTVKEDGPSSLLKKLKFFVTPSTSPPFEDLREIIEAGGGTVICNLPSKVDDDVIIVGCREDKDLIHEYQLVGWKNQIVEPEFLLAGSLLQKLDFEHHRYTGKKLVSHK